MLNENNDQARAQEIVRALLGDQRFHFHEKGQYLRGGVCPDCGKKELYVRKDQPWRVACSRENKCGSSWTAKELLPHLFENYEKRFPPTQENPKATADAYLMHDRGFNLSKCRDWYDQEGHRLKETGEYIPTIRFYLDADRTRYWERLIGKTKADGQKAHVGGKRKPDGSIFRGDVWVPPGQTLEKDDTCFITEGIFHAIALLHAGKKVVAAISSSNFPSNFIEANKGKGVTWALALDGDHAGCKYMKSHRVKILEMKESVEVCLLPNNGKDWDDLWQLERLDDAFIDECLYQGSLFTAGSVGEKVWRMFCRTQSQRHFTLDYGNALWAVDVDTKFLVDLEENNILLTSPEGFEYFKISCSADRICTVNPRFLYIERDELVGDQRYVFQTDYANGHPTEILRFEGAALASAKAFHNALLNNSAGGTYHGSDKQFNILTDRWFKNKPLEVHSIPYIGYEKNTKAWVFHDHAFLDGKKIPMNEFGYFDLGRQGVKPNMNTFDVKTDCGFNPEWLPNFIRAFHYQGLAVLVFWIGSLFVQQIRKKQSSFPFLEFTGEAGAGKSTVIEFCWRLVGIDGKEGLNIFNATKAARRREFSQVSNLPVVIMESDQGGMMAGSSSQYNYESLKDLFNGRPAGTIGVATRDNTTKAQNFLGTLVFSQNETVEGGEPILSRIVHVHADKTHHTEATREIAQWFEKQRTDDVGGFLEVALKNEKQILETIFSKYKTMEKFFEGRGLKHQRIVKCHAQIAACAYALQVIFPNFTNEMLDGFLGYLSTRAIDRQERIANDHPMVEKFWETYHYINSQAEGTQLNFSNDDSEIAVNLNHFRLLCIQYGQELLDMTILKRLLPTSKRHKLIEKSRTVWSNKVNKSIRCWVFQK